MAMLINNSFSISFFLSLSFYSAIIYSYLYNSYSLLFKSAFAFASASFKSFV